MRRRLHAGRTGGRADAWNLEWGWRIRERQRLGQLPGQPQLLHAAGNERRAALVTRRGASSWRRGAAGRASHKAEVKQYR